MGKPIGCIVRKFHFSNGILTDLGDEIIFFEDEVEKLKLKGFKEIKENE